MDESQAIADRYEKGELNGISSHLLDFVGRHKDEIRSLTGNSLSPETLFQAAKRLIQQRGSIHLPSEMADQIKEINNEIWYRGEKGDYDRTKIKEEWAMKYAALWRRFRVKEILYVADQRRDEILRLLA